MVCTLDPDAVAVYVQKDMFVAISTNYVDCDVRNRYLLWMFGPSSVLG